MGLKLISFMYLKVKEYEKKHDLKFSLEESPAESAARRLAKVDLELFPESKVVIKGSVKEDETYYTNSIHYAPDAPVDFIERIEKQSRFHPLIESGAMVHAFVGESKPDADSIMNMIEKVWKNTQCAQMTVSPEFTVCEECENKVRGLKDSCPYCGSTYVYGLTRIVGYFSRIPNWNKSKQGELKDRHKGNYTW
jgi:ribonucleoside-triphosphate reductase